MRAVASAESWRSVVCSMAHALWRHQVNPDASIFVAEGKCPMLADNAGAAEHFAADKAAVALGRVPQ